MTNKTYFFDSYAIIEVLKGNKKYQKYKNDLLITTKLNIFEVFYYLLRTKGIEAANKFMIHYYPIITEFNEDIIKKAAIFKYSRKNQKISMVDSIGYELARYYSITFLTGDKEFNGLKGVEFVK